MTKHESLTEWPGHWWPKAITLLLRAVVPVHVVARRLGRADPAVTLRTYAHVLAEQAAEVATHFAALVDTADGGPARCPLSVAA